MALGRIFLLFRLTFVGKTSEQAFQAKNLNLPRNFLSFQILDQKLFSTTSILDPEAESLWLSSQRGISLILLSLKRKKHMIYKVRVLPNRIIMSKSCNLSIIRKMGKEVKSVKQGHAKNNAVPVSKCLTHVELRYRIDTRTFLFSTCRETKRKSTF